MNNQKNLNGERFERITVLGLATKDPRSGNVRWLCRCDCGKVWIVRQVDLSRGKTKSCGCLNKDRLPYRSRTHGETINGEPSPEYRSFAAARRRCTDENLKDYPNYGGRGIEFRFDSFDAFLAELGRKPSPQHTLDRKNNNGHYEVGNVRWRLPYDQNRNKRTNVKVTIAGETKVLTDWAAVIGVDAAVLISRRARGWCDECSCSLPKGSHCEHVKLTQEVSV